MVMLLVTACNMSGKAVDPNDSCSSLEEGAKQNCYFENHYCSKMEAGNFRDSCIAELAKLQQSVAACDLIKNEVNKGHCMEKVAEITANPEICKNIADKYWADNCYYNLALNDRDPILCANIKDLGQYEDCYQRIALATNEHLLCDNLTSQARTGCIIKIAQQTKNMGLCPSLDTALNIDVCRFRVVKLLEDKEACSKIEIKEVRDVCLDYFK